MTRKAVYQHAAPYLKDAMNLPVKSVNEALPFYENTMGFQSFEKTDGSVTLIRDEIRIGLAENGGDPAPPVWSRCSGQSKGLEPM